MPHLDGSFPGQAHRLHRMHARVGPGSHHQGVGLRIPYGDLAAPPLRNLCNRKLRLKRNNRGLQVYNGGLKGQGTASFLFVDVSIPHNYSQPSGCHLSLQALATNDLVLSGRQILVLNKHAFCKFREQLA